MDAEFVAIFRDLALRVLNKEIGLIGLMAKTVNFIGITF